MQYCNNPLERSFNVTLRRTAAVICYREKVILYCVLFACGLYPTGDTVAVENGVYKILGRSSVDIIKSGGYKISALDIERHLMCHPAILDCAIVGLPDITWGQRVAAAVVLKEAGTLTLDKLKIWAQDVLPSYQIPSILRCLPSIPRNALGKVNKKELVTAVFPEFLKQR